MTFLILREANFGGNFDDVGLSCVSLSDVGLVLEEPWSRLWDSKKHCQRY